MQKPVTRSTPARFLAGRREVRDVAASSSASTSRHQPGRAAAPVRGPDRRCGQALEAKPDGHRMAAATSARSRPPHARGAPCYIVPAGSRSNILLIQVNAAARTSSFSCSPRETANVHGRYSVLGEFDPATTGCGKQHKSGCAEGEGAEAEDEAASLADRLSHRRIRAWIFEQCSAH